MITFWRILKTGFRNLFRNAWLSAAATAIMIITLIIMTFFAFSAVFVQTKLAEVKSKVDLTLFLKDSSTEAQIKKLQGLILSDPGVKSVEYVSKADALKRFQSSDSNKEIVKSINDTDIGNPFPASFDIKVNDINKIAEVNDRIKKLDEDKIVDESSLDKKNQERGDVVGNIVKISNGVARVGAVLSVVFLVIALLIIFNTIRMAIFTRREEIEIMKLVGATKWFIRGPFIIEGSLYGVLGATLCLILLVPLTKAVGPFLVDKLGAGSVLVSFENHFLWLVLGVYGLGILIGSISSWLAIARHLKV
ncbi:ABC transporter permease [bacterium]|nr:ABC transporter permease [bacterium]